MNRPFLQKAASFAENDVVIQVLLYHDVDVNAQGEYYNKALGAYRLHRVEVVTQSCSCQHCERPGSIGFQLIL